MKNESAAAMAAEVLHALDSAQQIPAFSSRPGGLDIGSSYAVTAALRAMRLARGERCVGRKIGFTNRTIWDEYKVYAPIWGDMFDSTVRGAQGIFPLAPFCEPRIEPEIVFSLARTPEPGMDERAILGCIDGVGHGFEIVQSLFRAWKFTAADCVAGGGLHGAYLVGEFVPIAGKIDEWLERLASFEIEIFSDGKTIDRGHARNVLGGPLSALKHLIELLAADNHNPPLKAGEIVTTGTVTRAFVIQPGERWQTRLHGLPLSGLDVTFG